jgi:hypothetical protein
VPGLGGKPPEPLGEYRAEPAGQRQRQRQRQSDPAASRAGIGGDRAGQLDQRQRVPGRLRENLCPGAAPWRMRLAASSWPASIALSGHGRNSGIPDRDPAGSVTVRREDHADRPAV